MNLIETERLMLRHLTLANAPFIFELLNDPEWLRFIGDRNIKSLNDAENYIRNVILKGYEQFGFGPFLVLLKDSSIPAGICSLVKRESLNDVDIGFAFLPAYRSKGYAFEATSATMSYAKKTLNIPRIVAIVQTDNASSINLLKRLGMKFVGMTTIPGDQKDLMLFSTGLKDESTGY